ncbi:DUF1707 domain-containing protein [Rhodococcus rhodochrous]|uniref:DUF1707 domain-containing protein n=1 Tax=Rhodococcus rhodochrous TaxID=1829 RepID=A0AAW4XHH0_RHORH|nr:DUF1707 domain-containing protein [Rhodococcus rhodochrous]MCD2112230.1 DUF1707 domain-containing protein [Rhodococcus rhodochrous]
MEHTSTTGPGTATSPLRISDAERETIVEELGRHLTAGRLTIGEFDERVARVYRAVTQDDAGAVLTDLPSTPVPTPSPPAGTPFPRLRLPLHQRIEWGAWATVGSINLVVWALVSLGTASLIYFWPIWVIVPWGLVLAGRTALGLEGGPDRRADDHIRNARRLHREHIRRAAVVHRRAVMHRRGLNPHCGRSSRTWY